MPSGRRPPHDAIERLKKLGLDTPAKSGPATLLFDIETAPASAYVWGAYRQNIIEIKDDWYMLCFAYKWLGHQGTKFEKISKPGDDKDLTAKLHALFDAADIIIAHNINRFDVRKANAQFLKHGLGPPSPFQTVDTLVESKRYFAEYQHNLQKLSVRHQLGEKEPHTGFDLWHGCMAMEPGPWRTMEKYNRQDVRLLEKLYVLLRPWIGMPGKMGGPNLNHWYDSDDPRCPKCGHHGLIRRGWHRSKFSEWQTYQCKKCKGYSRGREREPQIDGGNRYV